ncbi:MAG: Holliday junction resolvase RuvX, partial [Candidatus Gastranaerophilales bacterium]|nr:Holliday junction resolvase RuvX [Candidatus Gastranaerophilales bacterium]
MEKLISLDIGTKRIGVATCDPLWITTSSLEVIEREPVDKAIGRIIAMCREYRVSRVVVGLPYNMDGTLGTQSQDCQYFAKKLEVEVKFEGCFEDERLT